MHFFCSEFRTRNGLRIEILSMFRPMMNRCLQSLVSGDSGIPLAY